jgi:hypothetical protein
MFDQARALSLSWYPFVDVVVARGEKCLGVRAVGSAFGGRLHAEVDRWRSLFAVGPSGVCFLCMLRDVVCWAGRLRLGVATD